jgi:hypothetical protein
MRRPLKPKVSRLKPVRRSVSSTAQGSQSPWRARPVQPSRGAGHRPVPGNRVNAETATSPTWRKVPFSEDPRGELCAGEDALFASRRQSVDRGESASRERGRRCPAAPPVALAAPATQQQSEHAVKRHVAHVLSLSHVLLYVYVLFITWRSTACIVDRGENVQGAGTRCPLPPAAQQLLQHNAKLEQCARRMHCDLISDAGFVGHTNTMYVDRRRASGRGPRCPLPPAAPAAPATKCWYGERGVIVPVSAGLIL